MEVIKIGNIVRDFTKNVKEIHFIIIDIDNEYFQIAYDIISSKYSVMKSKGITTPSKGQVIENKIESLSGIISKSENIIETIDDILFLTKSDIFILNDIQQYREIKLKKIGI